ncbi:MAG: adenosine deaminase [Anaerolineales bacterium]|nr:adenosine deaminase [Anaerolineales bacterium]
MGDVLYTQLKTWPKIDLHRHLEGSLRLKTLLDIAKEFSIDIPGYDLEAIRPLVQITDEPRTHRHFLDKFRIIRNFFKTKEVVERFAFESVADAAADNVQYLELRFTPTALAETGGFRLDQVTNWVIQSVRKAEKVFDISVGLIASINRHEDLALGESVLELASERTEDIVGLDLAGDEVKYSATPFSALFHRAKKLGLGITVHAGEWNSPENIVFAVDQLYADRIGHGVRAIEDQETLKFLRERNIPLEICPTSNYQSGAVSSARVHPLQELVDLGLLITINTDDPSVSGIILTDEYYLAITELGLTIQNLKRTIINAARAAFIPENDKNRLLSRIQMSMEKF